MSGGGFEQAYNAQAAVDHESRLIVTSGVTQNVNDKKELEPALTALGQLPAAVGRAKELLADNGYFSEANVKLCADEEVTPYIAVEREAHHPPLRERYATPPAPDEKADVLERMKHRLKTPAGRAIYGERKAVVDPVFGIIKSVMGFRRFLLRALQSVDGEWALVSIAWNLKRMHSLRGRRRLAHALAL